jgi:membrane-bound lytic murein transglycosylase B
LLQLFLLLGVSFLSVSKAEAAPSPLQNLINFSKEKLTQTRKVATENTASITQVKVDQNQESDKNFIQVIYNKPDVPVVVSDPVEIERAVEFAANATGVRKNFIMGLLVVESDLGRNPGECTYQEVEDGANIDHQNGRLSTQAWNTFQERREIIKGVAQSLGYDYAKLNVSCNPGSAYVGTGGAMGIPQFMPDTWMEYKDRISAIVGKNNPDPWNQKDAAVAVALKLSDVYGVTSHNRLAERNAAKMYLSGTTSWKYDWYANQIFYWAENYGTLIT